MIYLNAFLLCGAICLIGQLIIEYTNFTPAHVNTLLVITGAFLSMIGIYDKLASWGGAGSSVPITNFGHILFKGAYIGYQANGMTGLLNGIFSNCSGGLAVTIIIAFVVAVFAKPKH